MNDIRMSELTLVGHNHMPDHKNSARAHAECRICLEDSSPFIIPCRCDGTVKHVHEKCLLQWANEVFKKKLKLQQDSGV